MTYALTLIEPPAQEPVSVAELQTHLRLDTSALDTLLALYLSAAREQVERWLGRQLITARYQLQLDGFPACIRLPRPPAQAVDSIVYVDSVSVLQVLSPSVYAVDTASEPGRVTRAWGQCWPAVQGGINQVRVEYAAGYGETSAAVPAALRAAILLLGADLFEHTGAQSEAFKRLEQNPSLLRLLWPYRIQEAV